MAKPTKAEMLAAIRRARGSLRRKPGGKPFAVRWAEYKAEERELEERKLRRHRQPAHRMNLGKGDRSSSHRRKRREQSPD
jgi:hypothetical protein